MSRKKQISPIRITLLSALLATAIFLTWQDSEVYNPPPSFSGKQKEPDAYLENSEYRLLNEQGLVATILRTKRAKVYADLNQVEIDLPELKVLSQDNKHWNISAAKGIYDSETEILVLNDNVKVYYNKSDPTNGIEMQGSQLKFENKSRFISSDQQVKIKGIDTTLEAGGMSISLDDQILNLHSSVKGTYFGK